MIFITLGSQKFQFDRLLRAVDEMVATHAIEEPVFAQIGASDYRPIHYAYQHFLNRDEFQSKMDECDLVITHGGTGAIIGAVKKGKKVVAVPRLARYGEHVDDHQVQLVQAFTEMGIIEACYDIDTLGDAVTKAQQTEYSPFISNTTTMIDSLDDYVHEAMKIPESSGPNGSTDTMHVLTVGNDPSVKGGITTVISQILAHDWTRDGIRMSFVPTYVSGNPLRMITKYVQAVQQIRRLLKQVPSRRPDVVHIHMSYKGSFVRANFIHRMCVRAGVPDIIHLHGSKFATWYNSCSSSNKAKVRALLREAAAVLVLGDSWANAIKAIEPEAKITVLPNAVRIPSAENAVKWNANCLQVLFMGVLIGRKGVSDLLDAVAVLRDQEQIGSLRFVIAGAGAQATELKAKAVGLGLMSESDPLVRFVGWTDGEAKEELYCRSQALVLPSYHEGLPMAVLEAIAHGMPVVATDVGDIHSAVEDGVNGYLIQPGDVTALSVALTSLDNWNTFIRMSAASRDFAVRRFDERLYFARLTEVYREVTHE